MIDSTFIKYPFIKYHSRLGESVAYEATDKVPSGTSQQTVMDVIARLHAHVLEWATDFCRDGMFSLRTIEQTRLLVGWGYSPPIVISIMISLTDHST